MNPARPMLLLIGGGGHAAVVADAARARGWIVAGCLDDAPEPPGRTGTLSRLGAIGDLPRALAALGPGVVIHAAAGDAALRRQWLDMVGEAPAPPIVHPSAVVSEWALLEAGVFIGPLAVVNARARVARGAIVNSGAIVEHDCVLEAFCHVAPGAKLAGGVVVGEQSLVGIGAVVIPGVRIGSRAIIGAAAAVVCDVPDNVTALGVPARWE